MGPSTASEKADRGGLGKMIGLSAGGDEPEHQVDCDGWMDGVAYQGIGAGRYLFFFSLSSS
jgi:hypothetical protein